ncbi:SIMPL domain-containing protein [uncultured Fibrobacter sp.]|uniref:SIMPL domain-containing protein n=1 Tax=uncultured Fibrobacter sp. TaxID=261512 RepID=UPI0025ED734A|nr:SIMPL domain-containing protein [uncultured Fibrobacter sp.]MBR3669157.1 SIMPL domain-containing protein [Fibrobacter sp.]
MISRFLNIVYLIALIVCVVVLIRTVKEERAMVPASANGTATFEVPRIEVSASESKKFAADKFEMGFRMELRGKDKDALFKRLSQRRSVIFDNVKALEIPESNVEQNSVDMRKEWNYYNGRRELAGYVATQRFDITVNRKADAAALVQALSSEPDIEIERTAALLKDEESVQSAVIKAASKKAMAKARDYAEGVGAGVGRVLLVNANGGGISYGIPRFRTKGVRLLAANSMMDGAAAPDESAVADSVEVEASVSIVVELK